MIDKETEVALLKHILATYRAILIEAAELYQHREEIMAGILMRETQGGKSPLLKDIFGTPDNPADDVGDGGHGHGLFQIDDRSFPEFCAGEKWKDPRENALFAAEQLALKRQTLQRLAPKKGLEIPDLERAAVAAYNGGEGNVLKALVQMKVDPLACGPDFIDHYTAGRDYSREVLRYARIYRELANA
jgi:hypothetical protein